MSKRKESLKQYLKRKRGISWNTLYKNFGVKKVNKAIDEGRIFSQMDGKPRWLGDF